MCIELYLFVLVIKFLMYIIYGINRILYRIEILNKDWFGNN